MKSTMAQAQSNWEADKMLDVYIHDYFVKRKLLVTAKAFMQEGKVSTDPVAIDAPGGFLYEWWSVFWDIFISRTNEKHSEPAAAYIETQQTKAREQQFQMQQLQLMQQRSAQFQRRDPNHPALGGSLNGMNSEGMLGQPPATVLAMKMYEERMKHPHSMDSEASPTLIDANRMALLKSATSHQGQLVHGNSGNMSTALQQIQGRTPLTTDIKGEVNIGATPKSLPMDASVYRQAILQSKSGLGSPGLNQGVTSLPLKGWPLTGIDQLRPSLGVQVQKPNLTTQNQYLLASQQQQVLAQAQAQNNLGNSTNYGDMDPRRLCGLPRGSLSAKDGQSTRNDGSICSQIQSGSPKMKMTQSQHSLSQQQEQLQQQQLQQNTRKRKQHSSSGAANSTGTGNTVGPSPSSPPSTHTPGDGLNTTSSMQHVNSVQKNIMMYGTEATGGLASSANLLQEDMERFGDVGALDDNVESFLSNDGGDGGNLYGTIKQSPAEQQKESSKGFTFAEFSCIRTRNSTVTCCHFSSDGKLLASAGDDMKVVLWNMDTLQTESTPEEHKSAISDVRFRPNSSQFATASFDKSVRLWDAANPSYCVQEYSGHSSAVRSLDFHPKKTDLFCFCDSENEIRYWNITSSSCTHILKGGRAQVRFQPRLGHVLAAASDKVVSIFDVETDRQIYSLQGHPDPVNYICWDANGDHLTSVSQSMVKIWRLASGECIKELSSSENQFYSCVFHPSYSSLLVIGGISSLELWNIAENRSMTISAHENIISALAQSPVTGMVASASHDSCVKLWK
ncbi:transcriptional corepressor LEUNIG_HOMOLOG-like isoform X3 [Gastrolobium bilobum]|uniref:transcriptional corepressor LEUNIG_HOMOLOG-like isoform X3 n=1 Tax=Gastrolobium bilobum TaxID=150636 RepID=UPI002AB199B3|nr:transcriptional corepressor LEUNIG_HOMOLOG-like isoform X3 [Gastrolobium bilobum]